MAAGEGGGGGGGKCTVNFNVNVINRSNIRNSCITEFIKLDVKKQINAWHASYFITFPQLI